MTVFGPSYNVNRFSQLIAKDSGISIIAINWAVIILGTVNK